MGQHVQKTGVGIRHRRFLRSQLQLVHRGLQIRATDQIQPFLHIILIFEMCILAGAFSGEEHVQVKLIKLALFGNALNALRDLVCKHNHSRQSSVGIYAFAFPFGLSPLLIGIGPVINLLLNELTGIQRTERRAGEIEVIGRSDRQPRFIVGVTGIVFGKVLFVGILILFKQLFCAVLPCAEMVFIENNEIPVRGVDPFVIGLDAAGLLVYTEKILKRAEADDGPGFIRLSVLLIVCQTAGDGRPCDELPALEIHVRQQILTPCGLHRRFEGEDQHTLHAHFLCQLIGRKGLAEAHLGVPQEFRRSAAAFLISRFEILHGHIHGVFLLRTHGEGLCTLLNIFRTGLNGHNSGLHIVQRAFEPLVAVLSGVQLLFALCFQNGVDVMVSEAAAVIFHGGPLAENAVRHGGGMDLFFYTGLNVTLGIANLDIALMGGHTYEFIGIYRRVRFWPLRKKLHFCHYSSPPLAASSLGQINELMNAFSFSDKPYLAYSFSSSHDSLKS